MSYRPRSKIKVAVSGETSDISYFLSLLSMSPEVELSSVTFQKKCVFIVERQDLKWVRKAKRTSGVKVSLTPVFPSPTILYPIICTILLFALIPYVSTFFTLSIEVTGPEQLVAETEVELDELHVRTPLAKKSRPDDSLLRQKLMTKVAGIAWVLLEENGSTFHITLIPAPTLVEQRVLPSAPAFVATEDAVVERIYLVKGERRVSRKDVVKKGKLLAEGNTNMEAQGEIRGTYWKELGFELYLAQPEEFVFENSHLYAILKKFIDSQQQALEIQNVKILHVQNENGKVEGKVLLKLEGNIAKPTYLKETMNDN